MQKKSIFLLVAILLVVGGIVWFVRSEREISVEDIPKQIVNPQNNGDDMTRWKTYRNGDYGFELKYPSNWIADEVAGMPILFLKSENFIPVITGYDANNKEVLTRGEIKAEIFNNPKNLSIKDKYLEFDDMTRLYFASDKMKYQETKIKNYDAVIFEPFRDNNPNWKLNVIHKIIILKLQNKILSFDYTYTDSPNDEVMGTLQEIASSVSLSR